jgi:ABC-type multidrug transport system fused ATPase/permease subunit
MLIYPGRKVIESGRPARGVSTSGAFFAAGFLMITHVKDAPMHFPLTEHRRMLGVYLRPQWRRVLLLSALILAGIALQLLNPQILRTFIDATQQGGAAPLLAGAALLYLLVGLAQHGAGLATVALSLDVGWRATNLLRADLLRHVLRLDMPFHKTHTPGALIERVDGDVSALGDFFAQFLVRVVANVLLVAAILLLVLRTNALAGATLAGYVLLTLAVLWRVQRIGVARWHAAREAWSAQMGFIEEQYTGAEDVRGVGAEGFALHRLYGYMRTLTATARAGWMAQALGYAATNFLYVAGYALGLALGAWLYLQGELSIGAAFVLVYYVGMLADPLDALRDQGEVLQQATVGVRRVSELFRLQPRVQSGDRQTLPAGALAVTLAHVSFAYADERQEEGETGRQGDKERGRQGEWETGREGERGKEGEGETGESSLSTLQSPNPPIAQSFSLPPTLHDITLDLPPGRVLGILGRTGSGKTTLTRLLCRLYDPGAGVIRLGGVDLRTAPLPDLRRRVGVVTQEVQLFQATLRDNITFFDATITDARIEGALAELGLAAWVRAMPAGLDTPLAAGGRGFSAGEAQLLAFTRLLLRDPGLVILDEAAARLDPITEQRLEGAIDRLLRHRTGVIVAHRLHTLQRADDILILEQGRVVEYGTRAELAARPDTRFAQLLRHGLEEVLA